MVRSAADILAGINPVEDGLKVTDIQIVKVFEVRCPLCPRRATADTYQDAIAKRRDHFFDVHRAVAR